MSKRKPDQTQIFSKDEGDNWFARNQPALNKAQDDRAVAMAVRWAGQTRVRSVCELGCSNGWRLAALRDAIPELQRCAGADVSEVAISAGRDRWPALELTVGSLDRPRINGSFDLVIVSFVFHWVSRERLAASVSSVDRLVRDNGALIVTDFLPDRPHARRYHHRDDVEIYTYKQDYSACFTGLGTYEELDAQVFGHSGASAKAIDPNDRASCVLLRKNLSRYHSIS
jgi:SAM-dependent methyltransferase